MNEQEVPSLTAVNRQPLFLLAMLAKTKQAKC